ncbi:TPA: WYL domain-containing protein, partial [Acinetobacter baumannii]
FTSQLVWWLRSFGKKLLHIEPAQVHNAVREIEPDSK